MTRRSSLPHSRRKGIDTVLRYTEEGRIYGATFIDHRTGCVLNGSRMGKELSANALQEHFTLPYAGQPPIPLSITVEGQEENKLRPLPGGNTEGTWVVWACLLPKARQWTPRRKPSSGRCSARRKRRSARAWECNQQTKYQQSKNFNVCHNKKTI